jgi:hypothetical protein
MPALALAILAIAATPSFAQNLVALEATATMPDANAIPMWGFFLDTGQLCTEVPTWEVGPALTAAAGGTVTVNVRNCLSEPVSVFIPGQLKATTPVWTDNSVGPRTNAAQRVRSFDAETAPGGTQTYEWTGVKEGTYLYHSGTHPQVQVQMGLYGALTVGNYGIASEATLVYSEIDPDLHAAVDDGTYGTTGPTSTFDYKPRYFLINGAAYPDTADISVGTGENVLLRFVNAGLKVHVPTLEGGLYMDLIAEDGNLYPFEVTQYGVELPAAKTIDARLNVGADGTYALYDRALNLRNGLETGGGMLTYIQASRATCVNNADCDDSLHCNGAETCTGGTCEPGTPPVCDDGQFCNGAETCNEATNTCDAGTSPTCDDGVTCTVDTCNTETGSCDNVPEHANCPDDLLYCNGDEFCDAVLDCSSTGDPCEAGYTCNETTDVCDQAPNIPPFANDDFAETTRNTDLVNFSVTANDVDADGNIVPSTVIITTGPFTQRGGTVVNNGDGTVTFTPKRGFRGTDTFAYTVNDNNGATSNVATVRINVVK